jgi:hypothetical protein
MKKLVIIAIVVLAVLLVPLSFLDSLPVIGGLRAWARGMIGKLKGN